VRTRARSRPGTPVAGDDRSAGVGDDAVSIDGDTVKEPVAVNTSRSVGSDDVQIDHGESVGSIELVSAIGGDGDNGGRVDS